MTNGNTLQKEPLKKLLTNDASTYEAENPDSTDKRGDLLPA